MLSASDRVADSYSVYLRYWTIYNATVDSRPDRGVGGGGKTGSINETFSDSESIIMAISPRIGLRIDDDVRVTQWPRTTSPTRQPVSKLSFHIVEPNKRIY